MKRVKAKTLLDNNNQFIRRHVEILMKNGSTIRGFIIGYYKDELDDLESPILKWHLVDVQDKMTFGIDSFGFLVGSIIQQKDIQQIKCIEAS